MSCAPSKPKLLVCKRALEDGKLVYMAASRLAADKPFYLLDPQALPVPAAEAAEHRAAARTAPAVDLSCSPRRGC